MKKSRCPLCQCDSIIADATTGSTFCIECGYVLEENTMVSDMSFVQTSSGAAAAAGTFVNIGATSARLKGPMGRASGLESSEETKQRNLALLRNYQHAFQMSGEATNVAERHLKLAYDYSFTKGRHIEHVIAVCLYMGCKISETSHMLIDFADILRINVYELGSTYLKWLKTLEWKVNYRLDPSIYIARFVALLEFGEDENKIKNDAVRIATRFKEDWIHEGRRTAGICGAAIYLAAQMNNYRRSIQEIVQVCKIADTTILKRLEEFSATASANLTVGDFRVTERPTEAADPPAFTRARVIEKEMLEGPGASRAARRGKKRSRSQMEDADESVSRASSVREPSVHSDVPLFLASPASVDRGRSGTPRAALVSTDVLNRGIFEGVNPELPEERSQTPVPNASATTQGTETADVVINEKEDDAQGKEVAEESGKDGQVIDELVLDHAQVEEVQDILQSQAGQMVLATIRSANEAQEGDAAQQVQPVEEDDLKDLDEEELDNYICDESEAQLRERVWTEFNLDYLRKLAAKRFKDQTGEDLNPKKKRKVKAKQAFTPGKTAFESVQAMMKSNKQFSKRINYDALKSALPDALDEKDDEDDEDFKEDETVVDEDEDPTIREFKKMQYQSDHDPADFYEEV